MLNIKAYFKKQQRIETPRIIIRDPAVFQQLIYLVTSKDIEIMLLGVIEKEENRVYTISELLIPPMDSNTGTFVTSNDERFGPWLISIPREKRLKMRMHLHTHPKMGVTPSGVDDNMIHDKVENISDFYIRIIMNQKLNVRIDFFDLENNLLYEKLRLNVVIETPYGQNALWFDTTTMGYDITSKDTDEYKNLIEELNANLHKKPYVAPKVPAKRYSQKTIYDSYYENDYADPDQYNYLDNQKAEKRLDNAGFPPSIYTKAETKLYEQDVLFREHYQIAETTYDLLQKAQDYILNLTEDNENNKTELEFDLHLWFLTMYDISTLDEAFYEQAVNAFSYEIQLLCREEPKFRRMVVNQLEGFYPSIDEVIKCIKGNKTKGFNKKELKMTVEEWATNAKYIKTPKLL